LNVNRQVVNSSHYHVPVPGFTQAVRVPANRDLLFVSGLTARTADGTIVAVGDIRNQTRQVLENLRTILAEVGATLDDVVRIVTYLRSADDHAIVHTIRNEYFNGQQPASTTVTVTRLFDDRQLIELEATAVLPAAAT
jgi:enamine deaminase RidA (YjgF/YER057c/UK114 family)